MRCVAYLFSCALIVGCRFDTGGLAVGADATALDATVPDARPVDDAAPDATAQRRRCPGFAAVPGTIALYTMDGGQLQDAGGTHHGSLPGNGVATDGPEGCGDALSVGSTTADVGIIADAPAWDLDGGSIELWVRPRAGGDGAVRGVLSRDASGQTLPGHFYLELIESGEACMRIQDDEEDLVNAVWLCSATALAPGSWYHVGINFGADQDAQLFVDGVPVTSEPTAVPERNSDAGIAGNDNPWVLGAQSNFSSEGTAAPLVEPGHVDVDHLRISAMRRDFSLPAAP